MLHARIWDIKAAGNAYLTNTDYLPFTHVKGSVALNFNVFKGCSVSSSQRSQY